MLMNVSMEKTPAGRLVGFMRIRSKTQGLALSLGDKVQGGQKLLRSDGTVLGESATTATSHGSSFTAFDSSSPAPSSTGSGAQAASSS